MMQFGNMFLHTTLAIVFIKNYYAILLLQLLLVTIKKNSLKYVCMLVV